MTRRYMKKTALILLACSMPAQLFAQQTERPVFKAPQNEKEFLQALGEAETLTPAEAETGAVKPAEAGTVILKPADDNVPVRPAAEAPAPAKGGKTAPAPAAAAVPEDPGRPGDRLVLPKQDPASRLISGELVAAAGLSAGALQSGGFVVGKRYTVSKGDTLWGLSGRYYKDPFLWGKIYNANFSTVADPDRIHPEEELIIPDMDEIVIPYRRTEALPPAALSSGREEASAAAKKPGQEGMGEKLMEFDRNVLSEELPEHQKEWPDAVKIVPYSWREDGKITAKLKGDSNSMDDSFSFTGEMVEVRMARPGMVKPGDYLTIYLKGGDAYDKAGKRVGRELQPAGVAEVVSVRGSELSARVIDSTTAISKGYLVKKK